MRPLTKGRAGSCRGFSVIQGFDRRRPFRQTMVESQTLEISGLQPRVNRCRAIFTSKMNQSIGDMYGARQSKSLLRRLVRTVVKCDRFHNRVWKAPKSEQICADLR